MLTDRPTLLHRVLKRMLHTPNLIFKDPAQNTFKARFQLIRWFKPSAHRQGSWRWTAAAPPVELALARGALSYAGVVCGIDSRVISTAIRTDEQDNCLRHRLLATRWWLF
jgi:hypothetical protein